MIAALLVTLTLATLTPAQSEMGLKVATATAIVVGQMTEVGREDVIA